MTLKPQAYAECVALVKEANQLQRKIFLMLYPLLGQEMAAHALGSLVSNYIGKIGIGDRSLEMDTELHRLSQRVGEITTQFCKTVGIVSVEHPAHLQSMWDEILQFQDANDHLVFQI
eukprot:TRINITY_DN19114_c0_g1_i1.p1 TRINITY_DN19114_c0_g1~~TRINITY_DN19114_c0_g1_i1.p1  ORF type:complete len:117 (-),score=6.02 TRINITY_DN19114_c0_g1_i1:37-387(-)